MQFITRILIIEIVVRNALHNIFSIETNEHNGLSGFSHDHNENEHINIKSISQIEEIIDNLIVIPNNGEYPDNLNGEYKKGNHEQSSEKKSNPTNGKFYLCKLIIKYIVEIIEKHDGRQRGKRKSTNNMLPHIFHKGTSSVTSGSNVYSVAKFHPMSFMTGNKKYGYKSNGTLNWPAPTFLETEKWAEKAGLIKEEILYGMIINDKDGLVLVDRDIMKKFKGLVADMMKQIAKSIFGTPISLNVKMFEPKSTLQRICDYWSFAPQFLKDAAVSDSPVTRMKYAISFAISGFYIPTKQLKPFNPLIGETFQGEFESGAKVYAEHISHYPTIERFLILDDLYKFHGYFDMSTKTESFATKINVYQKGPCIIDFLKTGDRIIYNMPVIKLLNASSEEGRSAIWVDSMVFVDPKNDLRATIKFATDKNYIHGFEGYITEHIFEKNYQYNYDKEVDFANDSKIDYTGKKMKEKIISKIKGSWLKEAKFDDVVFWDINKHIPNWIRPLTNVLPSDGRFREDLIWLFRSFHAALDNDKRNYEELAQGWKLAIEQIQRAEREIRKKSRPKK